MADDLGPGLPSPMRRFVGRAIVKDKDLDLPDTLDIPRYVGNDPAHGILFVQAGYDHEEEGAWPIIVVIAHGGWLP